MSAAELASLAERLWLALQLTDYNTRVVTLGVALLGLAAGVVGSFLLLRRSALLGDAMSHAALPGIALAFMAMVAAGGSGKALPGLLAGAAVACLVGAAAVQALVKFTRIKEDAAIGIVLSVFFGLGLALLGMIQDMPQANAAGLESFIYGKTASMVRADALLIGGAAVVVSLCCALLFKELRILCFDAHYAAALGWPVARLDALLIALVVLVTVIGLQAVGLILVIAFLITPAAAARFWTDRLLPLTLLAGAIGAASGALGALASATLPGLPAGAVIVLICSALFGLSMVFGVRGGVLSRLLRHVRLTRRVELQNFLRAMYEYEEEPAVPGSTGFGQLMLKRSWTAGRLRQIVRRAARAGLVRILARDGLALTDTGRAEARRIVRNHRLWEQFLLSHAEVAPGLIDRDADRVEHILGEELVGQLEAELRLDPAAELASPHAGRARA